MSERKISVEIIADTRQLRRQLILAEIRMTHSRLRRLRLRFALWRIGREDT